MIDCVVLDAGALVAVERGTPVLRRYLLLADQGVLTVVRHVALIAGERDAIVLTSDPHDLARWGLARQRIVRC